MSYQTPNIILVGLIYDTNLGDTAIYESTLRMIEKITKKNIEIRIIDLYGRLRPENGICDAFQQKIRRIKRFISQISIDEEYCNNLKKRCEENIDDNTVAIIFVGGGLIKYNHQIISNPMVNVLKCADKHHIPVMLSAVGVEGYSGDNPACQQLKEALNLPCIKVITTRDDITTLREHYVTSHIYTSLVADPACTLFEIYKKSNQDEKLIGLNVCRGGLFKDYERKLTEDELIDLWIGVYNIAKASGYKCAIMTNGFKADYLFAKLLYNSINDKDVYLFNRPQNVKELVEQITKCRAIIATRLHAAVIAYSYNIPCVSLVWNNKQVFFGKSIGREELFISDKDITPNNTWDKIISQIVTKTNYDDNYINSTQKEISMFLNKFVLKKEMKWD